MPAVQVPSPGRKQGNEAEIVANNNYCLILVSPDRADKIGCVSYTSRVSFLRVRIRST